MFRIDFDRLIALLLPTFLRRPVIYSVLHAAVSQLKVLYESFCTARKEHNYHLTHNGQVCYLQAVLNDHFKSSMGSIEIVTAESDGEWLYAISESGVQIPLVISEDHNAADGAKVALLSDEAYLNIPQNEFIVSVPADIYDSSLKDIEALVNKYKLITKRAIYVSKTA